MSARRAKGEPLFNPGWTILLPGLVLIAATVLIPAQEDMLQARWQRDQALALEAGRIDRIDRYREFLEALDRGEPALIESLAATQLNQVPQDHRVLAVGFTPGADAAVLPLLEPPPPAMPTRVIIDSRLQRWATGERTRVWLIGGGALCVMLGLLVGPGRSGERA